MCPDRQILSVYLDGELSSPWKEKLESHLALCPECREQLAVWRGLAVEENNTEICEKAKERVWANLNRETGMRRYFRQPVWQRYISIPLPAAAAAAILIIVFALALIRQPSPAPAQPDMANAMDIDMNGMIPVSDMNGVLQYLSSRENGDFIILHLPESRNFSGSGEPTILKAADYSRRNMPQ
jgi:hypothetical protein